MQREMESSAAASSSSALPQSVALPAGDYEVFMSFRGPDVRNKFASHLYTSLARAKIRTFRDEEELQKGEGIAPSLVRAIPDSKIYIPILSEQYASSKWCLTELAQMVECWKQGKGHIILPIFYFVDPRDVRKQQGSYQQAFEQHAQKHSPQTVIEWKEALREVGQMKGWHVTESCRYKRALNFIPECKFYEPEEMSRHLSLQLFCKHAFGMNNPPEEDAEICGEFVEVAAGLPLALKVIGSLLFHRGREFWEEKLKEYRGIVSTTENVLQERLKISYKDLSHNEKQIFLDIACFFIGDEKDLPYYMWSECDFYPESGIDTLIHRSLMKLEKNNRFWMHDHIRDLGRAIVKKEDVRHPYNRSRIWSTDDALDMLRNRQANIYVK
ncbi:unnamed protein product [Linum tenue]|uniref:TIR domain-containing protein n=1 Tax=Linum tenue TaxID=586396 RepID=A0AAV0IKN6_9ROSI|nr:unnamed protein product [Linum tenue]